MAWFYKVSQAPAPNPETPGDKGRGEEEERGGEGRLKRQGEEETPEGLREKEGSVVTPVFLAGEGGQKFTQWGTSQIRPSRK